MKCPTEKAAEAVMEFLPLSQFEFQFYTGFLVCNDHNVLESAAYFHCCSHLKLLLYYTNILLKILFSRKVL